MKLLTYVLAIIPVCLHTRNIACIYLLLVEYLSFIEVLGKVKLIRIIHIFNISTILNYQLDIISHLQNL